MRRAVTLAAGVVLAGPLLLLGVGSNDTQAAAATGLCLTPAAAVTASTAWHLGAGQQANAATIVAVAVARHLPARAPVVALAAALQESGLVNLPGGDRDSVGLFQQRPSQGWGTAAQLHDPAYAAGRFYDALTGVAGWQTLPLTVAAQAVQRSATPGAYARWQTEATALAGQVGASTVTCPGGDPGGSVAPSGGAAAAVAWIRTQLGMPYLYGGNGPLYDCSGLTQAAWAHGGVSLPRTSDAQWLAGYPHVQLGDLQPGDLVFYNPGEDVGPGLPGHVGMYVGGGQIIQDPHTGAVVTYSPVLDGDTYVGAVRPAPTARA